MTQIFLIEVPCPECGEKVVTNFLASYSSFGFSNFRQVDHVVCRSATGSWAAPESRRPDEEE